MTEDRLRVPLRAEELIAEAERLLKDITPGAWAVHDGDEGELYVHLDDGEPGMCVLASVEGQSESVGNAAFIAAAPRLVRSLVDLVNRSLASPVSEHAAELERQKREGVGVFNPRWEAVDSEVASPGAPTEVTTWHELKTWPEYFEEVASGRKLFEIRENDRGFKVGDGLWLREYAIGRGYSGREARAVITYMTDWQQRPRYVVLGLRLSEAPGDPTAPPKEDTRLYVEEMGEGRITVGGRIYVPLECARAVSPLQAQEWRPIEIAFKAGFTAHSYMAGVYDAEQAWQEYRAHRERMDAPDPPSSGTAEPT